MDFNGGRGGVAAAGRRVEVPVGLRIRRSGGRRDTQWDGDAARSPSAVDESQLVEKRKSSSPRPASGEVDSLRAVSRRTLSL